MSLESTDESIASAFNLSVSHSSVRKDTEHPTSETSSGEAHIIILTLLDTPTHVLSFQAHATKPLWSRPSLSTHDDSFD